MRESKTSNGKSPKRDEYLKWICGFANAQGGKIYIGMRDDGTVIGVQNAERLLNDLPNKIQNKLGIVADVNLLKEGEHEYIEIVVNPGPSLLIMMVRTIIEAAAQNSYCVEMP